jgi:hypothetical protein
MRIEDPIYGTYTIDDPALVELTQTAAIQRLKGIAQFGPPDEIYHMKNFSRYEHSIGVMLLLRMLGATLEEQIAGLLHDVSHSAFSHVVDWVWGDPTKEEHQDDMLARMILKDQELVSVLHKHGLDPERIVDHELFSLLEQPRPELCADRVDYGLREMELWASWGQTKNIIQHLGVHKGMIVINDTAAASTFATAFLRMQREHWGAPETVVRYEVLARLLRQAFEAGILTKEDIYQTDAHCMKKICSADDDEIQGYLALLSKKPLKLVSSDMPEFSLQKKFRYVDPLIDGRRLSELDASFASLLERERVANDEGVQVSIVR